MPNFISRLFRPLSSSTRLGITSEGANGVAPTIPEGAEKATIAAGCFWGVEHLYRKHFGGKGLIDARVGYTGGDTSHPSYRQVCSESTGREFLSLLFAPSLRIKEETKENQKLTPSYKHRRRSAADPLRPHADDVPAAPGVLLPDARPDDGEPAGARRRDAVPERGVLPRRGAGEGGARGHGPGRRPVVRGPHPDRGPARRPLVGRRGLPPAVPG